MPTARKPPPILLFISLSLACRSSGIHAQTFSRAECIQGYRDSAGLATFIFHEQVYGVRPRKIMVEGAMREWHHDMDDGRWELKPADEAGVWTLVVLNPDRNVIQAGTPFKFRIDDGRWMDPPALAPNVRSGNLIFAHTRQPMRLKAELINGKDIRLMRLAGTERLSLTPGEYHLTTAAGNRVNIGSVHAISDSSITIVPVDSIDRTRVYVLELGTARRKLLCSFDGWLRHLYTPKELGANFIAKTDSTVFRIVAPRATKVRLYLYKSRTGDAPFSTVSMTKDDDGVWEAGIAGNMQRTWYDFTVHGPADPGNEFFEQHPVHISDPYARVSDDSFGRSLVWPKTRPATPLKTGIPEMEDVIAYEVHVEDFTLGLPGLPENERGTFAGFSRGGLRSGNGALAGIDHIVDLGVNVIHLQPVQEFLHYPDKEWQNAFRDDPYMQEQGIGLRNYAWGYRTSHAFALETRYRSKGSAPGAQNEQFRDLVQACHDRGIAVVVDMVFNHTAERMDGREFAFHFRVLDRHLYYRTNDTLEFIGDYGTETKSEDRPMLARWIYDQCLALINEYGVDGFRIDLAGLTDKQTLLELKKRIGEDKIVYGEPWIASADPAFEANPDWNWYKRDAPITFFQDDTRNALCGPPDNPHDKKTDRGYAGGNGQRGPAKQAIANSFPDERSPNAGINYLDIHDNWALADRFATTDWNGERGVDEGPYRIAAAMLLTSLGPVVLHGGSEFMRSKGSAPLVELEKRTESGPIFIHGKRDTYNLRNANLFRWENLGLNETDGAPCNYQLMNEYWKGLIALRNSEYGKVFRIGTVPPPGYIEWIEPADSMQLGYIVADRVLVVVNTSEHPAGVSTPRLPVGTWFLVVDGYSSGITPIAGKPDSILEGGRTHSIQISATNVNVWVRK